MGLTDLYRRIEEWAQGGFLADSEAASRRDGYLSFRAEWHAAAWGFAAFFLATLTGQLTVIAAVVGWLFTRAGDRKVPEFIPYPTQFRQESAYLLGHGVAGVAVGLLARVVLTSLGVAVPTLDPTAIAGVLA